MSLLNKGFKHSDETKLKISKNLVHYEEVKKKLINYRHTEEAIAKL